MVVGLWRYRKEGSQGYEVEVREVKIGSIGFLVPVIWGNRGVWWVQSC